MVTTGFIRVRRRKLKPKYEWYTPSRGMYAGISRKREIPNSAVEVLNYDLVRAVRINGQPRHKFVLGFGSPASASNGMGERRGITFFWMHSFDRMEEHGFPRATLSHRRDVGGQASAPPVKEWVERRRTLVASEPEWGTDHEAHTR